MIFLKNIFSISVIAGIALICFSGCIPAKKPATSLQVSSISRIGEEKLYIAVMPVANLSRKRAPLNRMKQLLRISLYKQGFSILDDDDLERFMTKYRIRYVGGLDREKIRLIKEDTGVQAVFLTTLEHFDEDYPPKISVTSRLVSTERDPRILWVESIGLAGDDSPELLGLGLIRDPQVLLDNVVEKIMASLERHLSAVKKETVAPLPEEEAVPAERAFSAEGIVPKKRDLPEKRTVPEGSQIVENPESFYSENISYIPYEAQKTAGGRFSPKSFFRSSTIIDKNRRYSVAVLPFFNRSEKSYAGDIMANHFMNEMEQLENIHIIEPGVVRESLLKFRVVMRDGISLDNAAVLFSRLNADLIITGTVLDYQDYRGPFGRPVVDFSVIVIDRKSQKAIWTSKSSNEGDDSVFFFDLGKINTANAMASEMVRAAVKKMVR